MMQMFIAVLIAVTISGAACQTRDCLDCICGIESSDGTPGCGTVTQTCDGIYGCNWDTYSCSCGPYQIKDGYFIDCTQYHDIPINDWVRCSTTESCARQCVDNYLDRYGTYCTGKPHNQISCEEFGGIHNGGPAGCDSSATAGYREKVRQCCAGRNC